MDKQNLRAAHRQLFTRTTDECFASLADLRQHCRDQKEQCVDHWQPPQKLVPQGADGRLQLDIEGDGAFALNDWSFGQLCGLAGVSKETVNRLTPDTATLVFRETMPHGNKPLQLLTRGDRVRSLHRASYTRLWNLDLLEVLAEFAVDFQPPQKAAVGGTGLYAGEQDLFCFLIDPTGWVDIEGEAFAPGFFVWNSEVGCRSIGISTFWFQAVCANHIVWDAVDVTEFSRKHTASVHEALTGIREAFDHLVEQRSERRDSFSRIIQQAMRTNLGTDPDDILKTLKNSGIRQKLAKEALEQARRKGKFTVFTLLDALTRLATEIQNAGERLDADQKAASILNLVTT